MATCSDAKMRIVHLPNLNLILRHVTRLPSSQQGWGLVCGLEVWPMPNLSVASIHRAYQTSHLLADYLWGRRSIIVLQLEGETAPQLMILSALM